MHIFEEIWTKINNLKKGFCCLKIKFDELNLTDVAESKKTGFMMAQWKNNMCFAKRNLIF